MTAKSYLEQYRRLDNNIKIKQEQLNRIRELAQSISPSSSGGNRSGKISDKIGSAVAKLVDAENELNQGIVKLLDLKKEIERVISQVDDPILEQLLTLRYINGMTWEKIAVEMHYSYMHTCRLHGKALGKIKDVIECYT